MELDMVDAIATNHMNANATLAKRRCQTIHVRNVLSAGQQCDFPVHPIFLVELGVRNFGLRLVAIGIQALLLRTLLFHLCRAT
jgi:hypothetical protein